MDSLDDILKQFGLELVTDVRANAARKGITTNAGQDSGFAARITHNIRGVDPVFFELIMPEHGEFLDRGRGPTRKGSGGKPVLRPLIAKWAIKKGIVGRTEFYKKSKLKGRQRLEKAADQLAYVIARKIHRKGYKARHFYSEIINDGRVDELKIKLTEHFKKEVIIDILT